MGRTVRRRSTHSPQAVSRTEVAGSTTNAAFLAALARDPDFAAGDVDTGLIGRKQDELTAVAAPSGRAIALAALATTGAAAASASDDPWSSLAGYAHFHPLERRTALTFDGTQIVAHVSARADGRFDVRPEGGEAFVLSPGSWAAGASVAIWPGHVTVFEGGQSFDFASSDPFARAAEIGEGTSSMRAPMPGLVKLVRAGKGDKVSKGQPLLVLEAMKMEHTINATHDGTIAGDRRRGRAGDRWHGAGALRGMTRCRQIKKPRRRDRRGSS